MTKRKKKGVAYTKPKKQTIEKVSLTEEQNKELQDKIHNLKVCLTQAFIYSLITADITDRAKENLNEVQQTLKKKVDLFEPNIFKYVSLAHEKMSSAQHYFYKLTNRLSEAGMQEKGDNWLEAVQEHSDMECLFMGMLATILRAVQFDDKKLKVVWDDLLSLANKVGVEIDEEEVDWARVEDVCKTALFKKEKIEKDLTKK